MPNPRGSAFPFTVTCACAWTVPAKTFRVAQGWKRHHLEMLPPRTSPLWDGATHTVTITKEEEGRS